MRQRVLLCLGLLLWLPAAAQQQRHFVFRYAFTVRNVPPGQKVELWFPRAHTDLFQDVKLLSLSGDLPLQKARETRFGNTMFHAIAQRAAKQEYHFVAEYEVVRRERFALPRGGRSPRLLLGSPGEARAFLAPDRLVPARGRLAEIAAAEVQGRNGTLDRARALYIYVFRTLRYDKSGTGWGRGDAEWACDSHRGNCTDFHSLFMSLARSQQIPARFSIGFPLPPAAEGEIPRYHCWAEFYDAQRGWIPVDISEAWQQHNEDEFFGALDANRVQFSTGRDLVLSPPQSGEPLNCFVNPYVEVNGRKWDTIADDFSFRDVPPRAGGARAAAPHKH